MHHFYITNHELPVTHTQIERVMPISINYFKQFISSVTTVHRILASLDIGPDSLLSTHYQNTNTPTTQSRSNQSVFTMPSEPDHHQIYRVGQKKTGLFFRLDNFVTASPRKACSMSKFSKFYREKGTKLAFQ